MDTPQDNIPDRDIPGPDASGPDAPERGASGPDAAASDAAWWGDPDPAGERSPSGLPPTPVWKKWLAAGVGAVVIGAGAVFGINAVTSSSSSDQAAASAGAVGANGAQAGGQMGGQMPGAFGAITRIDGSAITVEGMNGTRTVTTSTSTKVITSSTATVADIKVGDHVRVMGSSADGTGSTSKVTAQRITDSGSTDVTDAGGQAPGAGGQAPADMAVTAGVVKSVDSGTITVTLTDGSTAEVVVPDSTQVEVAVAGSVDSLKVGDQVMVTGPASGSGSTVAAETIRVGDLPMGGGPGGAGGPGGQAGTAASGQASR